MTQGKPTAATTARIGVTARVEGGKIHNDALRGLHGALSAILEKQSTEISHAARR